MFDKQAEIISCDGLFTQIKKLLAQRFEWKLWNYATQCLSNCILESVTQTRNELHALGAIEDRWLVWVFIA